MGVDLCLAFVLFVLLVVLPVFCNDVCFTGTGK